MLFTFQFDHKKRNIIIYLFIVLPLLGSTMFPKQLKCMFDLTDHEQIHATKNGITFSFIWSIFCVCVSFIRSVGFCFVLFSPHIIQAYSLIILHFGLIWKWSRITSKKLTEIFIFTFQQITKPHEQQCQ